LASPIGKTMKKNIIAEKERKRRSSLVICHFILKTEDFLPNK
jgi:hypothetical protein